MGRTLIAAFGNPFRRDDGVGAAVANSLLKELGRDPLEALDDGLGNLGHQVDVIQVQQLAPELANTLEGYDLLIMVDAHVGLIEEPLAERSIGPSLRPPLVIHQTQPSSVLALTRRMYGKAPEGILLSVRGHDFEFGEGLSPQAAALVPMAVRRILRMLQTLPVNASPGRA